MAKAQIELGLLLRGESEVARMDYYLMKNLEKLKNIKESLMWLEQAALQHKSIQACEFLGDTFSRGENVEQALF